ncbi:hypothetical protein DESPIGER_2078 [Desulfovibrio piger]|uniref:Uncharacterized protein n=1 Tax=Desulfovibrio piger TaxID=901 RepID=A0A1K1LK97_9BACT|nr:hypothetical protein DESPIGER_2078 [Desulfovibrio piger]
MVLPVVRRREGGTGGCAVGLRAGPRGNRALQAERARQQTKLVRLKRA